MQNSLAEKPHDDGTPAAPRALNPIFTPCVAHRFDIEYGYQSHHWKCIQAAPRVFPGPLEPLAREGYEVRRVLAPEDAAQLSGLLGKAGRDLDAAELGTDLIRATLQAVFTPEPHATVSRYFMTEFAAIYFAMRLTRPPADAGEAPGEGRGEGPGASFRWHCDFGPSRHLKLLVYLNPSEEHDAATEVLDSHATEQLKAAGYVFGPVEKRLADLGPLAREYGIGYAPRRLRPEAGEALVFEPAGVLHKGVAPTRGERHMLQIGLIPWAEPWDAFLTKQPSVVLQNRDFGFPKLT